jgi:hypothetical protein
MATEFVSLRWDDDDSKFVLKVCQIAAACTEYGSLTGKLGRRLSPAQKTTLSAAAAVKTRDFFAAAAAAVEERQQQAAA